MFFVAHAHLRQRCEIETGSRFTAAQPQQLTGRLEGEARGALGEAVDVLEAREADVERHRLGPRRLAVGEGEECLAPAPVALDALLRGRDGRKEATSRDRLRASASIPLFLSNAASTQATSSTQDVHLRHPHLLLARVLEVKQAPAVERNGLLTADDDQQLEGRERERGLCVASRQDNLQR